MARTEPRIEVRRIYDGATATRGARRVLVDRLWPRGVAKDEADLDEWCKEVAPSTELRRWYGHDVERYDEFARRYRAELRQPPASGALAQLAEQAATHGLVLLTATRDVEHSGAAVLAQALRRRLARSSARPGDAES